MLYRHAKPRQSHAGILANVHPGRTSVILLAAKGDPVLPDPDDGGDDADPETAAFEALALLDMASIYPICRPRSACARARPARPTAAKASRMVRPLSRSRAASMSSSVTPPT